jgi:phosphopentomutase
VIARPFAGPPGEFRRLPDRRDYSVEPSEPTLLDDCAAAGVSVFGVGKIRDIFAGRGLTEFEYTDSNDHGIDVTLRYLERPGPALVFTNLVDFDTKYGHRNDAVGYARCVEEFDHRVPDLVEGLDGGVLFLTGDHGCDPTTPPTDHSRERTPLLGAGFAGDPVNLDVRSSFADLGATVAQLLGVRPSSRAGQSFTAELRLPSP